MSPTDHPVGGKALQFSLASEVQALRAELAATGAGTARTLAAGSLLSLPARVEHAVQSPNGGIFLLTVASPAA